MPCRNRYVLSSVGRYRPLPLSFFRRPAEEVARDLLGRFLVRELARERLVLRLVEVEAYLGRPDRASHAWDGRRTPRNESLYLPGGHAYVYFIYGMHWCLNAVTGERDVGSAVLILLYLSLMLRILFIAERQRSDFSRIYGYCVASILFFHFAVNLSMTIGLAPVIGITLPFLSYGGSSLLSFSILMFILIRLDADRQVMIR